MSSKEKMAKKGSDDGRQAKDAEAGATAAEELEELYKTLPLTEDTTCGIGVLRYQWLQRFSNEKYFVGIFGLVGCLYGAASAYLNGTISTIEKRFKIPSRVSGIIVVGHDISALLVGLSLSYYAGKKHRPRWICLGIYTVVLYCLLALLPHLLYGPGEEAVALTMEYGDMHFSNSSQTYVDPDLRNLMCFPGDGPESMCKGDEGGINTPAVILFLGNLISGFGGGLYYTIGMSYMDDNIEKHKTPFLLSVAHFLRLLGPALGYSLASLFLEIYIAPMLTPTIKPSDPRWLGAWWIGWILLSTVLFIAGSLLALFPKTLPAAAARKLVAIEKARLAGEEVHEDEKPSLSDMIASFWRLLTNKVYMSIQLSQMFYVFGYLPYWIFNAKYIETQYRISASKSSLFTEWGWKMNSEGWQSVWITIGLEFRICAAGILQISENTSSKGAYVFAGLNCTALCVSDGPFGITFSAVGTLLAGATITKYRPSARALAWWNLLVVVINTVGITSYAFIGCENSDSYGTTDHTGLLQLNLSCNANCSCDHVRYTPVCSQYGDRSYISPCHAGCSGEKTTVNGTVVYTDCTCISLNSSITKGVDTVEIGGSVLDGTCPSDCENKFLIFMCIVCVLKFTGATSKSSNFLVAIRCVEERDKTVSMALTVALMSVFTFIPSPIFFGHLIDKTCLVWGKSCSGKGNCLTYDTEAMRTLLNFTAAGFIAVSAVFDLAVWYFIKDVKIFDEEVELTETKESKEANEKLIEEKAVDGK